MIVSHQPLVVARDEIVVIVEVDERLRRQGSVAV